MHRIMAAALLPLLASGCVSTTSYRVPTQSAPYRAPTCAPVAVTCPNPCGAPPSCSPTPQCAMMAPAPSAPWNRPEVLVEERTSYTGAWVITGALALLLVTAVAASSNDYDDDYYY